MGSKAQQQAFDLLNQAPSDTSRSLVEFLQTEVCKPTDSQLSDIGNKTLARHLNGLINGVSHVSQERSTRARRASRGTPLTGKLLPWGLGSAGREGEWHAALKAVRRFIEARSTDDASWRIGQAAVHLSGLMGATSLSNRDLVALVDWLLDGELRFELKQHLHYRVKRRGECGASFESNWDRLPWSELGVRGQSLVTLVLPLCEGNTDSAARLTTALL